MDLTEHYEDLYQSSIQKIRNGTYQTDPLIDPPADRRFGLSLIIRPPEAMRNVIQNFLERLKQLDPFHYYYPSSDLHLTVLSIISCYEGFKLNESRIPEYVDLLKACLQQIDSFKIRFKGITASPSGVLLQGFPANAELERMRDSIRTHFKAAAMEHSIDQRYVLKTAHVTLARFRQELLNRKDFLELIKEFRETDFGTFEVSEVHLVFNDWYHRKENTRLMERFELQ